MALPTLSDSVRDILTRIKAMTNQDGSPMFLYASLFNDSYNLLISGKGMSFPRPACFVEMVEFNSERWLNGVVASDMYVNFHILHDQLDAGNGEFDMNLDVFDLRVAIRREFTSFNPTNFASLMYSSEKQDFKHNNVYHYVVTFRGKYIDNSGNPYFNGVYKKLTGGTYAVVPDEQFVPNLDGQGVGLEAVGSTLTIY